MRYEETAIPGVFVVRPDHLPDPRGVFFEGMRSDEVERETGIPFAVRQINYSVSRRNTLRGIHSVQSPPGQVKYVNCVRGALRDVVVDLRVGSPTFGTHVSTVLDADSGTAVLVPEGVGHGFLSLTDDSTICYALSTVYVPGTQIDIDPLDPELALPWGLTEQPLLSAKDASSPGLAAVLASGVLASWTEEHV